jgi:GntR family transcriptional regulator/MocR family aminotransferase
MIHEEKIPGNSKLESIRHAALHQGVSTTTMEHAYNQLQIEGYIKSIPRKGFYVETLLKSSIENHRNTFKESQASNLPYNLAQSEDMFDLERYRKLMNEVLSNDSSLYQPCLPRGEIALKKAISNHLRRLRDVVTHYDNVFIASGIQQLIIALGEVFKDHATVAYLKPGFKRALDAFELRGFTLTGYDSVEALLKTQPEIIYLSPSNLYPSGEVMPINERLAIIHHANENGTAILEDDYNHLFRYNAYQIPPIYTLSNKNNVIYLGSFSRSTLVSLRMSYMVVPDEFLKTDTFDKFAQTVSKPEQLTMARFIDEGHYKRHLNRLSRISKRKNDELKRALHPYMNQPSLSIYGLESNMHFVVHFVGYELKNMFKESLDAMDLAYIQFEEKPLDILVPYSGIPLMDMKKTMDEMFDKITETK